MTSLQPRPAPVGRLTATRPPTLLVVDDDDTLRLVLTRELRKRGFDVYSAGSGAEAVEVYRLVDQIDLVLLDVNMPGMSGPDAFDAIRAVDPFVRCCFMTADARPGVRDTLLARGATAVFGKPFASVKELCVSLKRLADGASTETDSVIGGAATWTS